MKADQERVAKLLNDTVTLLCKNGLIYKNNLTVQGLLGITLDKNEVFIVHINETIGANSVAEVNPKSKTIPPISNIVDLTKVADTPITASCNQPPVRYQNPSPVLGSARKQRPQMINQAMLLQRNELLQQVQHRLRMNTAMIPHSMGPVPVPILPMPHAAFQQRQPINKPPMNKQRPVFSSRRPCSQQHQSQTHISLVDEDDVVIVGTGREEPYSSPRRSHGTRASRSTLSNKSLRMQSNESNPIIIPQDYIPYHDNIPITEMSFPCMQSVDPVRSLHPPGFNQTNYLGEIVIEPTNSADVDIASIVGLNRNIQRSNENPPNSERISDLIESCSSGGKVAEGINFQDKITVYLDVADDGNQITDFKPCYRATTPHTQQHKEITNDYIGENDQQRKMHTSSPKCLDVRHSEESLNLDSLGFHMLTEGDDDPRLALSWQCKVPTCQALYTESSQLANHYISEHTQQLDLSVESGSRFEVSSQLDDAIELGHPESWKGMNQSKNTENLGTSTQSEFKLNQTSSQSETKERHPNPLSDPQEIMSNESQSTNHFAQYEFPMDGQSDNPGLLSESLEVESPPQADIQPNVSTANITSAIHPEDFHEQNFKNFASSNVPPKGCHFTHISPQSSMFQHPIDKMASPSNSMPESHEDSFSQSVRVIDPEFNCQVEEDKSITPNVLGSKSHFGFFEDCASATAPSKVPMGASLLDHNMEEDA